MTTYEISNSQTTMGHYEGETAAHALAAMHRDAGYRVSVDADGDLVFASAEDERLCGGLDCWKVKEV